MIIEKKYFLFSLGLVNQLVRVTCVCVQRRSVECVYLLATNYGMHSFYVSYHFHYATTPVQHSRPATTIVSGGYLRHTRLVVNVLI